MMSATQISYSPSEKSLCLPDSYVKGSTWDNLSKVKKRVLLGIIHLSLILSLYQIAGWQLATLGMVISIILSYFFELKDRKHWTNFYTDNKIPLSDIISMEQRKTKSNTHDLTIHLQNDRNIPLGTITKKEFIVLEEVLSSQNIPINTL